MPVSLIVTDYLQLTQTPPTLSLSFSLLPICLINLPQVLHGAAANEAPTKSTVLLITFLIPLPSRKYLHFPFTDGRERDEDGEKEWPSQQYLTGPNLR